MAKNSKPSPKRNNSRKGKATAPPPESASPPSWTKRLGQEMAALLLLGLAGFCFLALVSHTLLDPQGLVPVWQAAEVSNRGGKAGALLAAYLVWGLGLAALVVPLMLLGLAWESHRRGLDEVNWVQTLGGLGTLLAAAGIFSLAWPRLRWGGSWIHGGGGLGDLLSVGLTATLNPGGAALVLALLLLVSVMGATRLSYVGLISRIGGGLKRAWSSSRTGRPAEVEPEPRKPRPAAAPRPVITKNGVPTEEAAIPAAPGVPSSESGPARPRRASVSTKFTLPTLDLLDPPLTYDHQVQEGMMLAQAQKLEDTLRSFGVEGRVTAIMSGPVVSRFELEPAPGVKISKVTGLADDLALGLRALSIRIVAPVPGKAVIGIEVPNPKRQVVALREILADNSYQKSASRLTIALGKDIMGQPMVTDLAKMPHLLIAGATGSGKSVGLNAMILSVLFKASPEEVRFLLIDPKRIELALYEGIPHLLHPVVVTPKEATLALHWAVGEMERRYAMLSELGVRHIEGYNQKARSRRPDPALDPELPRTLPYLVIVIDELADLMLVSSRDTEEYLIRLAQKARAAGIHLIVATQRPSVDVITGLIKANFPTRISYQVSAKADSRVILDTVGAERLLGMGDLLFLPPGTSRQKRIHGAFVTEAEVARVVEFLKSQVEAMPEFQPGLLDLREPEADEADLGEKDEKYDLAVELVAETRNASISMLQRRLRIGYNRAARIIETMEREGMIGPSDGLKAREVYIPRR